MGLFFSVSVSMLLSHNLVPGNIPSTDNDVTSQPGGQLRDTRSESHVCALTKKISYKKLLVTKCSMSWDVLRTLSNIWLLYSPHEWVCGLILSEFTRVVPISVKTMTVRDKERYNGHKQGTAHYRREQSPCAHAFCWLIYHLWHLSGGG